MDWNKWRITRTLMILGEHALVIVAAALLFKLVSFLLGRWAITSGWRTAVEQFDQFVLFGLFLWFTYQMALLLWKNRVRVKNGQFDCLVLA